MRINIEHDILFIQINILSDDDSGILTNQTQEIVLT
jgi:hypothetical protein